MRALIQRVSDARVAVDGEIVGEVGPGLMVLVCAMQGERLYERFAEALRGLGIPVATGIFAADMAVTLTNDGPVTIWLEA